MRITEECRRGEEENGWEVGEMLISVKTIKMKRNKNKSKTEYHFVAIL